MPCHTPPGNESIRVNLSQAPCFRPAIFVGTFGFRKMVKKATCGLATGGPTLTRGSSVTCTWTRWPGFVIVLRSVAHVIFLRQTRYRVRLFHFRFHAITALFVT